MAERQALFNVAHRAKVIPPKLPARLLPRPQLVKEMEQLFDVRLTLIVAAAGYGKTTMLLQTFEEQKRRHGAPLLTWLQLDEYDTDKVAFFNALISSVEYSVPGFFRKWRAQLVQMSDIEFAKNFGGELAAIEKEIVLVLDDMHMLLKDEAQHALKSLSAILEQLPPNVHCVITTRRALMLDCLPRMRARQELALINKEQFFLSTDEVQRLLRDIYEETVSDDVVRRVANQVEGWITGLILLRQARHVMEIQAWDSIVGHITAGSHEFFYAYFMSEVYENLSENMRKALRLVAELPEWNAEIVEKIYGEEGADEFTRYVNDENALFVLPVDDSRTRFRFHPMFREFLRAHGPVHSALVRKLAEHEYEKQYYRIAARLYQQSKTWGPMLEALYNAQFSTRKEILSPNELHDMVESVPAGLRQRLQVWWVLRAAELIALGKPAEVSQLPVDYKKFREPYRSKYLTMLVVVMRSEGKYQEIVDTVAPGLERFLAHPEEICSQEIIALSVNLCLALVDVSRLSEAKKWVDWIEQRKTITPDYEEDDLTYLVLRAYYMAVKNKKSAVYYAEKAVEYCKTVKPNNMAMSMLNLGITESRFEMLDEAEQTLVEAEHLAQSSRKIFIQQASISQLAQVKAYEGNMEDCLMLLNGISLEDKRKNSYVAIETTMVELTVALRENRPVSTTALREIQETYEQLKNKDIFFALGQIYRRNEPGKMNLFVEKEGQYFMEHAGDIYVQALARLAVESERMRMRPKLYATWEHAARDLFAIEGIENWQPGEGDALYLLEVLENIPALAPNVLQVLEYSAHTVSWYLNMEWARLETETKSALLQFLVGRMDRPNIAHSVKQLLEKLQIDPQILETTKVIQQTAVSPHLSEHEVGEILLKYGTATEATANALKEFSVREPAPLFIRMFGKFEIMKGDVPIVFPDEVTQPMLSLLKFLVKNKNQGVTMDLIGSTIWKDVSEKQAKSNVYTAISLLRTALEPYLLSGKDSHFILSADRGYKFVSRTNDLVDTEKFADLFESASTLRGERGVQALTRAVELYRGPYLEENMYDSWTESDRDRLQQQYMQALEQIVAWHRKMNSWGEVDFYAVKGFELDPANEEFCGGLIEAAAARREMITVKKIFLEHQNAMQEFYRDSPSKSIQDLYLSCLERFSL